MQKLSVKKHREKFYFQKVQSDYVREAHKENLNNIYEVHRVLGRVDKNLSKTCLKMQLRKDEDAAHLSPTKKARSS